MAYCQRMGQTCLCDGQLMCPGQDLEQQQEESWWLAVGVVLLGLLILTCLLVSEMLIMQKAFKHVCIWVGPRGLDRMCLYCHSKMQIV